jgi:uncharacterized membrane protein
MKTENAIITVLVIALILLLLQPGMYMLGYGYIGYGCSIMGGSYEYDSFGSISFILAVVLMIVGIIWVINHVRNLRKPHHGLKTAVAHRAFDFQDKGRRK